MGIISSVLKKIGKKNIQDDKCISVVLKRMQYYIKG